MLKEDHGYGLNLLVPALLLLLLGAGCDGAGSAPAARRGVIDLSATDRARPVRLDGEWEFYWNRLLSPREFGGSPAPSADGFLPLPNSWNGFEYNGEKLHGAGAATFRLRILPGPGTQELALHIGLVNSAYRLWANDALVASNGVLGADADGEKPIQSFLRPRLLLADRPVDLVLQISNHHDREGGVLDSLVLGTADRLEAAEQRTRSLTWIGIGSLMVMGIYHVFLYVFRTKNAAPLYFGIYCLLWMAFSLFNNANDWPVRAFIGVIPSWMLNRLDLICVVVSVPVIYGFLRTLYPSEFPLVIQRVVWATAALFVIPGLAASTMTFTSVISFYWVFCITLICFLLVMLGKAARRKREGALYILFGFLVLGIVAVNDMLYDLQAIRSVYLIQAGMLAFILFQACALSLRLSRAFSSVERLSDQLAEQNAALERDFEERTRLEREIVNTSEEERRLISRELHDGLCQKLTAARLHFSVLARKLPAAGEKDVDAVSTLIEESVNQAYDLSRGLWPVEYDPRGISPSLEELTRRLSESSGISIEFTQRRACSQCANPAVIQVYRIAQEAITNAVKHARPRKISVGLDCSERKSLALTVRDDGIGRGAAAPSKKPGGMGISIMSHRARMINGTLAVTDAEGGGTLVTCTAPCAAGDSADAKGERP